MFCNHVVVVGGGGGGVLRRQKGPARRLKPLVFDSQLGNLVGPRLSY